MHRLGCGSVIPAAMARASSSSFRQNGPSRSKLSAGMVRQSPGSLAETALEAPALEVSALRIARAKTRPIVGCCQILRRHIDDISNTRGHHFLPRFRTLGEASCVAHLQLSSLFLDSSTCTCSGSRFHDAVRDLHLNARTRTLRATTLSRRRLLGAIDRVDDDA
jgi:hypothetical protein